jgi:hypothetical protein
MYSAAMHFSRQKIVTKDTSRRWLSLPIVALAAAPNRQRVRTLEQRSGAVIFQ